jgi:hypothetical protein
MAAIGADEIQRQAMWPELRSVPVHLLYASDKQALGELDVALLCDEHAFLG